MILLGAIGPALTYLGASAYWERAIQGGIILAALVFDSLRSRSGTYGHGHTLKSRLGSGARRVFPNGEASLLLALLAEVAVFSVLAQQFFTLGNFFEVLRFSTEIGLLALALTPIIVTGGIDLSVGLHDGAGRRRSSGRRGGTGTSPFPRPC